ncbi:MAG: tRNA uridine-5-carboxymethylaminomethyl(34) synthesis enzyme MnmG [Anaerolineae bacterium]|nr:tRNA uridine-5-carboxymethylaminomethyl(34) synthesis enzyme MnmG [Anaerolineae bacterium]
MVAEVYDVVVVGAGHAGCEAAMAAARKGCCTCLVTMNLDLVAQMPCNPSIGGPAKAHVVREIDALGGAMGRCIDRTFVQIRMLNLSRGPAVHSLRAQADKRLYSLCMKHMLEATPGLSLRQGTVESILTTGDRVGGVRLANGSELRASAVVLTPGTFLNGEILSGRDYHASAGRAGEFAAVGLTRSLRDLGFELGRLQTNTPPRVDARSIDFAQTRLQPGSDRPLYFSFDGAPSHVYQLPLNPVYPLGYQTTWRRQMPCYQVHTNDETHRVIRANLHRSPVTPGNLDAHGPRYCPSIEEKLVRFPDKPSHIFFLEPEGAATTEIYVQGCFTGLPVDVQQDLLHTIPALSKARIMRPGYAVSYDYVPAHQIRPTMETRRVHGLFLAGQINGTSGYEEAAGQGLLAGTNAACYVRDEEPLVIRRDQGYLGVMVDDLVTKDLQEPYRLFTSRAEYRLLLRQDNADLRLTELGHAWGLVDDSFYRVVETKKKLIQQEIGRLRGLHLAPEGPVAQALRRRGLDPPRDGVALEQVLKRPGVGYDLVQEVAPPARPLPADVAKQVEIALAYEGYIARQACQVERALRMETRRIPEALDYGELTGLRAEAQEKLMRHRPATVGQAARIEGVTPCDIGLLLVHLERLRRQVST